LQKKPHNSKKPIKFDSRIGWSQSSS